MARRNDGVASRILLWFFAGLMVVATAAGIKFVLENDIGGGGSSSQIVPIPSEPPISSSEEPPSSSEEEPPVVEEMPNPLDMNLVDPNNRGQANINLITKPIGMTNAYRDFDGEIIGNLIKDDNEEIYLPIKSNSIKWDVATNGFTLGFSSTHSVEENGTYEEFYYNYEGDKRTYASALIFDFTMIHGIDIVGGFSASELGTNTNLNLFYRESIEEGWMNYKEQTKADEYSHDFDVSAEFHNQDVQFAIVFQSNSKSNKINLSSKYGMNLYFRTGNEILMDPQPEGLYRLQVQSDNEYFTHLKSYEWGGYELEWQQEFEHGEAYSIIDFKVDSQYDNEFVFITTTANGTGEEMSDYQFIKVFANGVDEVFIESPTQGHQNIHLLEGVNTMTIVELSGGGCVLLN